MPFSDNHASRKLVINVVKYLKQINKNIKLRFDTGQKARYFIYFCSPSSCFIIQNLKCFATGQRNLVSIFIPCVTLVRWEFNIVWNGLANNVPGASEMCAIISLKRKVILYFYTRTPTLGTVWILVCINSKAFTQYNNHFFFSGYAILLFLCQTFYFSTSNSR